jgi:putative two-component system response regulator
MPDTILLVDDNPKLLSGASLTLEMEGFQVVTAVNGYDALQKLENLVPDLIVSDIMMPGCDGFELLEIVQTRPNLVTVPFIFLTALNDDASIKRGKSLGVDDYLTKPFSSDGLVQAVKSRLERARTLQTAHTSRAYIQMLQLLARAIESRDSYTGRHIERVSGMSQALGRALGWSEEKLEQVRLAAIVHDLGKVIIPDAILNKPGRYTPEEYDVMKTHSAAGADLLEPLKDILPVVYLAVRHHHERYDGKGYPDGLAGKAIPEVARLIAIVDAFDAIAYARPYREGMGTSGAAKVLTQEAGSHFDPEMIKTFQTLLASPTFLRQISEG